MASSAEMADATEPTSAMDQTQTQGAMTATSPAPATQAGPSQALNSASATPTTRPAAKTIQSQLPFAADAPADGVATGESDADDDDSDSSSQDSDYDSDGFSIDDVEKEIERSNRIVKFDKDGSVLWKNHESSYAEGKGFHLHHYNTAMMYDKSSATELRKFVGDRGLHDPYPQGVTLKYLYLRTLEQADMSPTFKFLGLPLEMRNGVYRELLTLKDYRCRCKHCSKLRSPCYTAILRTSKEVYNEAKHVLYGENTIDCTFAVCTDGDEIHQRYTQIHNKEADGYDTRISDVFWGMEAIPGWFRRIHSLRIDLSAHGVGLMGSARWFLQGCTLNLASFLLDGHSLKKLEIKFTDHLHLHEESNLVEAVLYPFRRLSGLNHVSITGDVHADLSQSLTADMQRAPEPTLNTMPCQYYLRSEAMAFLEMTSRLETWRHRDSRAPDPRLSALETLVEEVFEDTLYDYESEEEDLGLYHNAKTEKALKSTLNDLKGLLCLGAKSNKVKGVDYGRGEFMKIRALRKAYEAKDWANKADGPTYDFDALMH